MRTIYCAALLLTICALASGAPQPAAPRRAGRAAPPPRQCARQCVARDCENFSINYGRYCGVTHTGCAGTPPCDAYDACCHAHDGCVSSGGLGKNDQQCHRDFTACLKRAQEANEAPWTQKCDVGTVVKTMTDGIELASKFADLLGGGGKLEL